MDITHIGIVPPKRNMIYSYYIYIYARMCHNFSKALFTGPFLSIVFGVHTYIYTCLESQTTCFTHHRLDNHGFQQPHWDNT